MRIYCKELIGSNMVIKFLFLLLVGLAIFATSSSEQSRSDSLASFELQKLADGVYAAIRKEPPGLTVNANSVFIINEHDVVVVDTTLTPSSAQELLAALRTLTDKPVSYVINTHWHDDHVLGNAVFRKAFPRAEFIAHQNTRDYLPTTGLKNRLLALSEQGYPQFIKALRNRLQKNESVFGGPMNDEERITYASDIKIAESYVAQNPTTEVILPTITIQDRFTLHRGKRTIDVHYFGRGHTSGDLVVELPAERILVAGDLVIWPVPYVGSPQSHPRDWSKTLLRLVALQPQAIVPGHGPVLRSDAYLKQMSELFAFIADHVDKEVAGGATLEETSAHVNLSQFEETFAGDSRMRKLIFRNYVVGPAIEAAYLDAKGNTKLR